METEGFQIFPKLGRSSEEMIGDSMRKVNSNRNGNNGVVVDGVAGHHENRMSRWHHNSSRIIRVSRASGGKDRHSKVWTSKGPRDRRVRLSVSTALQFYDLQDRLGYDQPSKAVEWLITAASDAISELPSLNATFLADDERIASSENRTQIPNKEQAASLSKSACSSNSDTSKNSSLSLSRSELRGKARERARERTAKEKERENHTGNDNSHSHSHGSFTELLTGSVHTEWETASINENRQWMASPAAPPTPMEYFSSGLIHGSGQSQFPVQTVPSFSSMSDHHHHHHHPHPHPEFSFVQDHMIPQGGGGSFNLDFNISSSSAMAAGFNNGLNRVTLQSNSQNHQSFLANLHRFSSDGSGGGAPFFVGAPPAENHQHNHQFQLHYENGGRNASEHKGKGKN